VSKPTLADLSPRYREQVRAELGQMPRPRTVSLLREPPAPEPPAVPVSRFERLLRSVGLPAPVREHRFHPVRRWRFDYAWLEQKVALEVDGGVWTGGRHTRGAGFVKDMEKLNAAVVAGWRVVRVVPGNLCSSATVGMLESLLVPERKSLQEPSAG
jgi:hypothetical protein